MIRRVLSYILASALAISQAQAGWLLNPFMQPLPSLSFVGCTADASAGTTFTFTNHDVGAAGNRDTIVGVASGDGAAAFNTSSVTVGGASAAEVVDEAGSGQVNTSLHIVDNPTGTAEDIVVTMSESVDFGVSVCVWAAYDLISETAVSSTADDDTAAGALILDLSATSINGIAVGVSTTFAAGQSQTWTGLTEQSAESAAHLVPTDGSALTVRADWTGTADASGVAASFR